ncbi:DUF7471 family protein [Haladaptatus caseinilyticus]|uniref:DUF7471 family protein n=1 Tax=Haladaptatus caseinilyticus TaxID=2993314 RepID=UPI00224B7878|nr:hypothetical protein [Haladaptatus caseinilyticus]
MASVAQPLHALAGGGAELMLPTVLVLAAVGSAVVFTLSVVAFRQRRSVPYLLVALAFGALAGQTLIGGLTTANYLTGSTHHLAEHALDVVIIALLIGAVYYARKIETR